MKKVILKSITMQNFRGEHNRTTEFNPDETFICGRNGLGKSRHFDATIWLLFGKDVEDRKDYEIKTRVDGEELHNVETSVEGVFDVDGETITLKRVLIEDWVKPRGTTERVFKGNRTECHYNGTPVSVSEYTKRVDAIIDATLFKMLTNPAFFAGMKWQNQREQLMQIAGTITDADIVAQHPEFAALLDAISGKSLADYRKEIAATKKKLQVELDQIQPRIDQTNRMMPEAVNEQELTERIAKCDADIAECDAIIADASAAVRKSYDAAQARQREIGELRMKQQEIVINARAKAKQDVVDANAARNEIEMQMRGLHSELTTANIQAKRQSEDIARNESIIAQAMRDRETILAEWYAVNDEQYSGETICPHCKQELPQEMRDRAMQMFNTDKANRLAAITKKGQTKNDERGAAEMEIERIRKEQAAVNECIDRLKAQIDANNAWLTEHPVVREQPVIETEIDEWVALQAQIDALNAQASTDDAQLDTTDVQDRKKEIMNERDMLRSQLSANDARRRGFEEIGRLEQEGKDLAQQIADIEQRQFSAESFVRIRVNECEKRINALFTMVRFRLFDYTQDGNEFETCIPMVNGVPYGVANTASQVNAGLDIINALVRHYDISAPIFIDGRERVNNLIHTESQIINLVVTDDEHLVIK